MDIPQELKEQIKVRKEEHLKPVKPENMHITLKFLGEIKEDMINRIEEAIRECFRSKFKVRIGEVGGFPRVEHARVIFLEIESEELQSIADCIHKKTVGIGDDRPFKGHLTLARARNYVSAKRYKEQFSKFRGYEWEVNEIKIVKSVLTPAGPKYSVIKSIKL